MPYFAKSVIMHVSAELIAHLLRIEIWSVISSFTAHKQKHKRHTKHKGKNLSMKEYNNRPNKPAI